MYYLISRVFLAWTFLNFLAYCGEGEKMEKISRNKRFPVCVGTRLMMFVWSVKHLHDMELNYRLSNAETGLLNLLLWITEPVLRANN